MNARSDLQKFCLYTEGKTNHISLYVFTIQKPKCFWVAQKSCGCAASLRALASCTLKMDADNHHRHNHAHDHNHKHNDNDNHHNNSDGQSHHLHITTSGFAHKAYIHCAMSATHDKGLHPIANMIDVNSHNTWHAPKQKKIAKHTSAICVHV